MWHIWGRNEMHTWFWWENLKERDQFDGIGIDGRKTLKWFLNQ